MKAEKKSVCDLHLRWDAREKEKLAIANCKLRGHGDGVVLWTATGVLARHR